MKTCREDKGNQEKVIGFIQSQTDTHHICPSLQEIADSFGKSRQWAYIQVSRLISNQRLERIGNRALKVVM